MSLSHYLHKAEIRDCQVGHDSNPAIERLIICPRKAVLGGDKPE